MAATTTERIDSGNNAGRCNVKHCTTKRYNPTHSLLLPCVLTYMQVAIAQCKYFYGRFGLFALLVGFGHVHAADVTLSWQPSSSTNVAGYNIYYGIASGDYTAKIMVSNVTTTTISNLSCGNTYFFSATALDSSGNESGFSNETQFLVPGLLALSLGGTSGVSMVRAIAPANASPLEARTLGAKVKPVNPMVIKFPVAPSHWYQVQATVDFMSWTTIWQMGIATSNAWVQCSDPDSSAYSSRFYRLVIH